MIFEHALSSCIFNLDLSAPVLDSSNYAVSCFWLVMRISSASALALIEWTGSCAFSDFGSVRLCPFCFGHVLLELFIHWFCVLAGFSTGLVPK